MSSLRIFHIVDQLHQKVLNNPLPFGGIQVILGGDFCQRKPIQDILDSGDPIHKSILFGKVFPHRGGSSSSADGCIRPRIIRGSRGGNFEI